MEENKKTNEDKTNNNISANNELMQLKQLYLSTSEKLAAQAYEATALQQQLNMLAQQVTINSVIDLYSIDKY